MRRRGFTLIELLLASALTALIVAGAAVAFREVQDSARLAERLARLSHTARVVLDMMSRDLACATSYAANKQEIFVAVSQEAPGPPDVEPAGRGEVHFLCRRPATPEGSDFLEVSFFIQEDAETGKAALVRRWQAPPDEDITMGGTYEALTDQVSSLTFEYYDGVEWLAEWTDVASLPLAVRISLEMRDEGLRNPLRLSTVVPMPTELVGEDLLNQTGQEAAQQ